MNSAYPADLYAPLHRGNEGDVDFYRAVCAGAHRVLELGCGSGRILAALSDEVAELTGVDSSEDALALARRSLPASVELRRGDMETFDVGGGFDRVLVPFNGLYCLPDLASVRRTFVQVEKALAPDGLLVFDGYAGDPIHEDDAFEEGFDEEAQIATVDARGQRWRVFERSEYERSSQRFTVHYRYLAEDNGEEIRATIRHRYLRLEEALEALESAGLEPLVVHGDFDQRVYDNDSEHMIITAKKPLHRDILDPVGTDE
ncbi:MAG: class I SAM-dependent methyltransferase [Polyangiales bacterium]